jgi:hypothetical protein
MQEIMMNKIIPISKKTRKKLRLVEVMEVERNGGYGQENQEHVEISAY